MRQFIRHPSSVPISCRHQDGELERYQRLCNYSEGGLSVMVDEAIAVGSLVEICIPIQDPPFCALGEVVWSSPINSHHYQLGVRFSDENTAFAVRMIEQICHIEQYRHEVEEQEGRSLSSEEAATEWIGKHAGHFPGLH
ncbi:PilZ domain-containing protein [Pokkaliibacter sp. MBI-7]|uniref:PilZ domain-containing protein n=1 Tax=Proteobacteria bacterium 228 TaxID=2083153 RepID=A0A2S5KHC3_9PROT|nr:MULTISPECIES: PilZ domain-containing protein [Pokkaliibacter]MDH2434900.1 PilZ domain-containing protein [Pokkaliibacter sp. MBI-7]PPC74172.1 hypothetical protein C4K68_27610 [Pokkaliibacter plantistimulans]